MKRLQEQCIIKCTDRSVLLVALPALEGRAFLQGLVCALEGGQGHRWDFLLMPV